MSDFDEGFVFDGQSGLSCEAFVRLVRQYAFSKDRGKDDEWIAQFAATRMDGAALRWLEDQPEEIQDSWKLLRRAVLMQWPPAQPGAQSLPAASSNAPTPAAAPPQSALASPAVPPIRTTTTCFATTNIRGRIRISSLDGVFLGYVGRGFSKWGFHVATRNASDAVQADFRSSGDVHEIVLLNSAAGSQHAYLGITWDHYLADSDQKIYSALYKGAYSRGGLVTVVKRPQVQSSATDYQGPSATSCWSILSDGTVLASYEVAPRTYVRLSFVMGNITGSMSLTNNYTQFSSGGPLTDFTEGKLVFEPM